MGSTHRNCRQAATIVMMVAACSLFLMNGCAGGGGMVKHPGDRYPALEFMVATATSAESMEDAETRARAALAAQIRSQIRSVVADESSQVSRGDDVEFESSTRSVIRQEAAFDHMELFHIDEESRRRAGGRYHAAVYLKRSEARRVLRDDYTVAAERMQREASSLTAVSDHDLPGFAARYGEAQTAWDILHARALEMRAVAGTFPVDYTRLRDQWLQVERERHRRIDGLELAVVVLPCIPTGDPLNHNAVREKMMQALDAMGLVVRGRDCGAGQYLLEIQPRFWHRGMAGVVTRLTFAGQLRDCLTGDRWEFNMDDYAWVAEGARAEDAVRKVQELVTAESLRPALAGALQGRLPLR